ncbi:MAG: hypothetical protein P8X63_04550 [Desulfuromonadaceae bacterium]
MQPYLFRPLLLLLGLMLLVSTVSAQETSIEDAEKLMVFQMEALKAKDHQKFLERGNAAFRNLMDEYFFDTLVMQRQADIADGYRLEYLGNIRRIGMHRHLWKVHTDNDKHQLLGSLSISHGKVVGFNLE